MRSSPILALCAALTIPQLALADLPLSTEVLGRIEAIVAFCSKINPEQAQRYAQPGKTLLASVPQEELSAAQALRHGGSRVVQARYSRACQRRGPQLIGGRRRARSRCSQSLVALPLRNHPGRERAQRRMKLRLFACVLAGGMVGASALPTTGHTETTSKVSLASSATKAPTASAKKPSRHPAGGLPDSARKSYELAWGVDQLSARLAESGQLVRFDYRITDVAKAAALNDKAASPYLLDEKVHAVLKVPTMEKVGPLRQSTPHRVSVVIGPFRVDGLIVQ